MESLRNALSEREVYDEFASNLLSSADRQLIEERNRLVSSMAKSRCGKNWYELGDADFGEIVNSANSKVPGFGDAYKKLIELSDQLISGGEG